MMRIGGVKRRTASLKKENAIPQLYNLQTDCRRAELLYKILHVPSQFSYITFFHFNSLVASLGRTCSEFVVWDFLIALQSIYITGRKQPFSGASVGTDQLWAQSDLQEQHCRKKLNQGIPVTSILPPFLWEVTKRSIWILFLGATYCFLQRKPPKSVGVLIIQCWRGRRFCSRNEGCNTNHSSWGRSYEGKEKNFGGMGSSQGKTSSFNRRPRRHEKWLELGLERKG